MFAVAIEAIVFSVFFMGYSFLGLLALKLKNVPNLLGS
jgi:hypothetical protein